MLQFQVALCVGVLAPERPERGGLCCPVKTEANGDSRSTYEKGPSLVGPLGSSCRHKRFYMYLGSPVQKYFFSHRTLLHFICLHRPAAGQAVVPRRLSLNMCLWSVMFIYKFYRNQPAYKIGQYKDDLLGNPLLFSLQGGEGWRLRVWRRLFVGSRRVICARRPTAHTFMTKIPSGTNIP